jgi:hypothetical protein
MDVLLLADCFENYCNIFLKEHEIDPCYFYSTPGLTWECGWKYYETEWNKTHSQDDPFKLELLTDYDMLLMFEKGIRGGYSGFLGSRYVKANNKFMKDYNPNKKSNYLLYLDANNQYGWLKLKTYHVEFF